MRQVIRVDEDTRVIVDTEQRTAVIEQDGGSVVILEDTLLQIVEALS